MKHGTMTASILAIILAGPAACDQKAGDPKPRPGAPAAVALPAGLFLAAEPAGTVGVEEAVKNAKVGDTVAVRGRIGGSKRPFVDGRAVFTIVGRALSACTDVPGHNCKTPWDYCHELPEDVAEHSATVQIVDAQGGVLKTGLKGHNGVKELSEVVAVGRVAQADEGTLVVNATGLYVATP